MSTMQSGGLFTNRVKANVVHGKASTCGLCGARDGMIHRLYHCTGTQELRQGSDWELLRNIPRASMSWGLFGSQMFWHHFGANSINCLPLAFEPLPPDHELVHILADFSCSVPNSGRTTERRAAWAIRVANLDSEWSMPVSAGCLPGRKQIAYRSELFAVCCAMSYAKAAKIDTDCKGVHNGIQRLIRLGWEEAYRRTSQDLDLWRTAWSLLPQEGRHVEIR